MPNMQVPEGFREVRFQTKDELLVAIDGMELYETVADNPGSIVDARFQIFSAAIGGLRIFDVYDDDGQLLPGYRVFVRIPAHP